MEKAKNQIRIYEEVDKDRVARMILDSHRPLGAQDHRFGILDRFIRGETTCYIYRENSVDIGFFIIKRGIEFCWMDYLGSFDQWGMTREAIREVTRFLIGMGVTKIRFQSYRTKAWHFLFPGIQEIETLFEYNLGGNNEDNRTISH